MLLGRILRNLLSNAIRYTSRGHVGLHVEARGDGLRIVVEDSGPGIAAENREAIFQEFVRLDPEQGRGLGLGLSIVQRLAEFLGHPLDVESRLGEGTRFSLEVPRAAATAGASAAGPDAPAAQLAGRRVLLVDEDLDVLAGTRVLLETWGVDVRLATDRSEALAALEGAPLPDLILADYRLGPNETGTAVIEALRRAAGREIPAIVVTGSASPEVVEELSARGIPRLKKPVQPARLRATLHSLVGAAGAGGGD